MPFARYEPAHPEPLVDVACSPAARQWPVQLTAFLFGMSVLGAQIPLSTFARTDPDVAGYGLGADAPFVSTLIGVYVVFLAIGAFTLPLTARLLGARGALVLGALLVALGYALWLPFHDSTTQALVNMAVAGLGSGALVAALPAAAAAAAPPDRTGFATGMTNATKTVGGAIASSIFAIALSSTGSLEGPAKGTAPLGGYLAVWAVCAVAALLAAWRASLPACLAARRAPVVRTALRRDGARDGRLPAARGDPRDDRTTSSERGTAETDASRSADRSRTGRAGGRGRPADAAPEPVGRPADPGRRWSAATSTTCPARASRSRTSAPTHDPDWWLKRLIEREQITGVLPPALQLRKDDAELDARLDRHTAEPEVRREVEEFNARVMRARYTPVDGPPLITMPRDVDAEVAAWRGPRGSRAARAARRRGRASRRPGRHAAPPEHPVDGAGGGVPPDVECVIPTGSDPLLRSAHDRSAQPPRTSSAPLAVGAPAAAAARSRAPTQSGDPLLRPEQRQDGRQGAGHGGHGRRPARQPRGRRQGRQQGGRPRRAW